MAEIGPGYGGGGAGGGEEFNDSFTSASRGAPGRAFMMEIRVNPVEYTNRLKVKVSGTDYTVGLLNQPPWEVGNTGMNMGKIVFSTGLPSRNGATRSFRLNPFRVSNNPTTDPYVELKNITGFKSDVGLHASKLIAGGTALNVIYSKSHQVGSSSFNYVRSMTNTIYEANSTAYTGYIGGSGLRYYYFLLQAGGGGGGGADNSWGLFNYASGTGGGGGGGATVFRILTNNATYHYTLSVGSGGSAGTSSGDEGSLTNGGKGGDTSLVLKYNSSTGDEAFKCTVSGGSGGAKSYGNSSPGAGGNGGQRTVFSDSAGIATSICIVDGGGGRAGYDNDSSGSSGAGDGVVATSGSFSDSLETALFNCSFTALQEFGTRGSTGSRDDRGGGGGASYLGNGGYY